jgi:acetyl esterase/lipase
MTWHPSRIVAVVIIATVVASIANCSAVAFDIANAPAHLGSFVRHANIGYGSDPRQSLDVYVPSGATHRPVVIFWYGGAWVRGTKERYRFVGAALANAGYVAILPDYRLYPQVRFPDFIEDGAQAVRWARDHASDFGGDPQALFLMGHSAGAHIAASLALDPRYLRKVGGDTSWVRGWVGLSGPYALELLTPGLTEIFRQPYNAADWQPIAFVNASAPAALLLHGTNDELVHPRETVELQRKLLDARVAVECHMYAYRTHTDTVAAFSPLLRFKAPVLSDVSGFIDRTLAGTPVNIPCPTLRLRRDWSPGQAAVFNGR